MRWRAVVLVAAALVVAVWLARRPARRPAGTVQRGVALGLFASDPEWDYGVMLRELAALGATDVELAVAWDQGALGATTLAPRAGLTPSRATMERTIAQAHAAGLRVLLFPLVRVEARSDDDWRGRIAFAAPREADAWWTSYRAFVREMAELAQAGGVERLSVGSELLGVEADRARWAALVAEVRARYRGRLLYSANWDHFDQVPFWDLVDEVGVTAYFELSRAASPSLEELTAAWRAHAGTLARFAARLGRPLVLTEVGYPAQPGAAAQPWHDAPEIAPDLELQRRCYAAFATVAEAAPFLAGVYFWNWFGIGGGSDAHYTPRGKPAAEEIRRLFARWAP